ncbi:MAG: hypothetical protein ACXVH7_07475, partial [Thermoanaerobaculia bacterium]
MPKRVHIAADVEPSLLALLRNDKRFDVTYKPVRDLTAIDAGCQILVTRTFNKVTDAVMNGAPHLRVIAQGTSGVDNIDLAAADKRGIRIISLPGINANAVAELVIGFIIALTRTVPAYNRQVVNAGWAREDCATRHELRHYRLGIAGLLPSIVQLYIIVPELDPPTRIESSTPAWRSPAAAAAAAAAPPFRRHPPSTTKPPQTLSAQTSNGHWAPPPHSLQPTDLRSAEVDDPGDSETARRSPPPHRQPTERTSPRKTTGRLPS